ncbi:12254_t:CDS:1, partial [Dentiscutata heterogama]
CKKISSAADYEKLYDSSLKTGENWIIVTKSLVNENQIDMMEKYSEQTKKYLKRFHVNEFEIIDHLKELYFDEYAMSIKIKFPEKELFLCFMNHKTKIFKRIVIEQNYQEWLTYASTLIG